MKSTTANDGFVIDAHGRELLRAALQRAGKGDDLLSDAVVGLRRIYIAAVRARRFREAQKARTLAEALVEREPEARVALGKLPACVACGGRVSWGFRAGLGMPVEALHPYCYRDPAERPRASGVEVNPNGGES
ncbi:MAG: hypothetical protein ACRELB_16850 [Polyangiaceae bacterium]